ncbi:MAG: 4'-phosphopantetheinyl transferase superfamily protein [Thermodesulfobacteriota bacterium]
MYLLVMTEWKKRNSTLEFKSDEVHVWRAALNLSEEKLSTLKRTLSTDEITRAQRYGTKKLQTNFIAARGQLREILSLYLSTAPGEIEFGLSEYDKPFIKNPGAPKFNISHSGALMIVAVSEKTEVGIDIEIERESIDFIKLSRRFFSPAEAGRIKDTESDKRKEIFFKTWTKKEAYVKAVGKGLRIPLASFSVNPDVNETVTSSEGIVYSLAEVNAGEGYSAAVAVRDKKIKLKLLDF